jgi:hypothetical protein
VAQCAEGIGSPEFARKLESFTNCQSYLDEIRDTPVEIDQWQLEKMALTGLKHKIVFYTPGASRDKLGGLGAQAFTGLKEAVASLLDGLPAGARVALVPEGPYTFARA